jgi:hypothetical protein
MIRLMLEFSQFHKLIDSRDIKVPKIDQQAKVLSGYLTSYEFAVKQRVAISNHLESLRDEKLVSLLKKELKRAKKLEDKIFKVSVNRFYEKDTFNSTCYV